MKTMECLKFYYSLSDSNINIDSNLYNKKVQQSFDTLQDLIKESEE